jgi:hypothetical protein
LLKGRAEEKSWNGLWRCGRCWSGGLLYDFTGSYTASWLLSVAAGLVTAVLAVDLKAPAKGSR